MGFGEQQSCALLHPKMQTKGAPALMLPPKGEAEATVHPRFGFLFTKSELLDNRSVAVDVYLLEIAEKAASLTDHLQQTSAAVVVFFVLLQMLGERVDPCGEDRDLYLGGACVALVDRVLLNNALLFFFGHCHGWFHLSALCAINFFAGSKGCGG